MKNRHPRTLTDSAFSHPAFSDPLHAVATAVTALTGHAFAGARVESFTIAPTGVGYRVAAEISVPDAEGVWSVVDDITRTAARYAPYVLFREPLSGAGEMNDALGEWHTLGDYATPAEGFDVEHRLRVRGLTLALMSAKLVQSLLRHLNELDFLSSETFAREDGEEGIAFELFQQLDAMTESAQPGLPPVENLLAAIGRFDPTSVCEIPHRIEISAEEEDVAGIKIAKAILQSVSLMGALLPGRMDPHTGNCYPSLSELQRRRERARSHYEAILAGPGLTDADRDFLLASPPDEHPWWDVLLGSTSGTGQEAMRILYAGMLAFWERLCITRSMHWAGDPMRQEMDAPLPIVECYSAWTGYQSGRFVPCLSK